MFVPTGNRPPGRPHGWPQPGAQPLCSSAEHAFGRISRIIFSWGQRTCWGRKDEVTHFAWSFSAPSSPFLDGVPITVPPFWTNPHTHTQSLRTPLGYKSGSRLDPALTRGLCQPAGSCATLLRVLPIALGPHTPQPRDGSPPPHSCLQEALGSGIFRFQDDDVLMANPSTSLSCTGSGPLCTQPTGGPEPWRWGEVHPASEPDSPFLRVHFSASCSSTSQGSRFQSSILFFSLKNCRMNTQLSCTK